MGNWNKVIWSEGSNADKKDYQESSSWHSQWTERIVCYRNQQICQSLLQYYASIQTVPRSQKQSDWWRSGDTRGFFRKLELQILFGNSVLAAVNSRSPFTLVWCIHWQAIGPLYPFPLNCNMDLKQFGHIWILFWQNSEKQIHWLKLFTFTLTDPRHNTGISWTSSSRLVSSTLAFALPRGTCLKQVMVSTIVV